MTPAVSDTITIEGAVLYRGIPINDVMVRTFGRLIVNLSILLPKAATKRIETWIKLHLG